MSLGDSIDSLESFQNDIYEFILFGKKNNTIHIQENGIILSDINGGYWTTPSLKGMQVGAGYYSPFFESMYNVWQLSIFLLDVNVSYENYYLKISLSHIKGKLRAEKIRIGIEGDKGEYLTCDEYYPIFNFPLIHVVRLSLSYVNTDYERSLQIFMRVNSKGQFDSECLDQSKNKIALYRHRVRFQKTKIYSEIATQTEIEFGKEKCNQNYKISSDLPTQVEIGIGDEKYDLKNKEADIEIPTIDEDDETYSQSLTKSSPEIRFFYEIKSPVPRGTTTTKSPVSEDITSKKNVTSFQKPYIKAETYLDVLHFRSTGSAEKILENALELYEAADMYGENKLKELCKVYIHENICVENFCDVLALSISYSDEELKASCYSFFVENALDIFLTSEWKKIRKEHKTLCDEMHFKRLKDITMHKKYMV